MNRPNYNYLMNMPGAIDGNGLALEIARLDVALATGQQQRQGSGVDAPEWVDEYLGYRDGLSNKLHRAITFTGMATRDAGLTYEPAHEVQALIDGHPEVVVENWIHSLVSAEEELIRSNSREYPAERLAASIPGLDLLIARRKEGLSMFESSDEGDSGLPFGMDDDEFIRFCEFRRDMWGRVIHDSIEYADQLAQDGITVQPAPEIAALLHGDVESVKAINEWRVA